LIGAICAAPAVVLAKHGLLQGHTATCYPGDKFVSQLPSHDSAHNVVVSGNIITSKGPGTAMEFSLKLVGALFGHEKEEQLKREMIFSHT
jgi:4-methyl-5(b-hydroxyethyl)-thiazole monophosphate biosynthesis